MIFALVLLTIIALIAAIGAIYRVRDKYKLRQAFTVQETTTFDKPQLESDLDSEQPIPALSKEISEHSTETSTSTERSSAGTAIPPFAAQPELDIPLAASIGVTDVLNPQIIDSPHLDLDHSDLPQVEEQESPSVLEEISQLETATETIEILAKQAEDSDVAIRATAAAALGEIAKGQNRDRAIALLNQLSQDVDPIVRTQAATSLGSIPLDIA